MTRITAILFSLILGFAVFCCNLTPVQPARTWSIASCSAAGQRIQALDCRNTAGKPLWVTPKGKPFAQVCESASYDYHAAAISSISDCAQINTAFRVE
jgi:hypothetical protein